MTKALFTICLAAFFNNAHAQNLFATDLRYGNFSIGFKDIYLTDWSRPSLDPKDTAVTTGREMNINIWYPAKASAKKPLQFKDYVALTLPQGKKHMEDIKNAFLHSVAELSGDTSVFAPVIRQLMISETRAVKNAAPAQGTFPVVLYPDNAYAQSILCEYLASYGYIVVSPGIKGTYGPPMEYTVRGIETAVEDLQFAVGYVRQNFKTVKHFSVMGLGFNATNVLALQLRNSDISAMISLEGGITTGFEDALIQRSPYFDLAHCKAAMLIIHAPHPDVKPELTYKYKYADRIYQKYPQSSEFYFLNFGVWEKKLTNIFPKANKGKTWESFEEASVSIKSFLDWKLKGQIEARDNLMRSKPGIIETSRLEANLLPLPPGELIDMITKKGIAAVEVLYYERRKKDPQPFPFTSFFHIGQTLVNQAIYTDLRKWAHLFADSYPFSAIPYTMQALVFLETGEKEKAKAHYIKAAELLENDDNLNNDEKKAYKTAIENRLKSINDKVKS